MVHTLKRYTAILLFALLVLAISLLAIFRATAISAAERITLGDNGLKDSYVLEETVEFIPTAITVGEYSQEVMPIIHFPNGIAKRLDSLVLQDIGEYLLEYKTVYNNKVYRAFKSFSVYQRLVSFSGNNSKVEYGQFKEESEDSGLIVDLAQYETFQYNRILDLNEKTRQTPFIKLEIMGLEQKEKVAEEIYIKLEDINDADNFILIRLKHYIDQGVYMGAGASNQGILGRRGDVYYTNGKGEHTFGNSLGFAFDAQKNEVYVIDKDLDGVYRNRVLINFTEDFIGNEWSGFSNNFVKLSIYAQEYAVNQTTNFLRINISDICDDDISQQNLVVDKAQKVTVNYGDYSQNDYPNALKGYPYKLFDYDLKTLYGLEKVDVRVFYEYGSSFQYEIEIVENAFTPRYEGNYTIQYTVKDKFGNESTEGVIVYAQDSAEQITVDIPYIDEEFKRSVVGTKCFISDGLIVSGGIGKLNIVQEVKHKTTGESGQITENFFVPHKEGLWTVLFKATDYVGRTAEFSYEVNAETGDKAIFDDIPVLPKYFIKGARYELPYAVANDYSGGVKTEVPTRITIKTSEGREFSPENNLFIPDDDGLFEITYTATSSVNQESSVVLSSEVIDVGYGENLDKTKYFTSNENISVVANNYSVDITGNCDGAKTQFINPFLSHDFYMVFNIGEQNAAERINFYLTDIKNKDDIIKISLIKDGNSVLLSVNDKKSLVLPAEYVFGNGKTGYRLEFNGQRVKIASTFIDVTEFLNGRKFDSFYGQKFYMSIEYGYGQSNEGDTVLIIQNINGQPFDKTSKDTIPPRLFRLQSIGAQNDINSLFTIKAIRFADVLDPDCDFKVTITEPSGSPVVSADGIKLEQADCTRDYDIMLNKYGSYKVSYEGRDTLRNVVKNAYMIIVPDKVPPEIKLSETEKSVKLNSLVGLPSIEVTDNYSSSDKLEVHILLVEPNNQISDLRQDSFTAEKKGVYKIRFVVFDEAGNMAIQDFTITVN